MLKILGILMVFTGCSLTGILIDLNYRKRVKELEEMIYALECLKGEISYKLSPLQEASALIGHQMKYGIGDIFTTFSYYLQEKRADDVHTLWKKALEVNLGQLHFNEEDTLKLEEFGRGLGYLDKQMQQVNIDLYLNKFKSILDKALSEQEKSSKLRMGMGILIGACISILII